VILSFNELIGENYDGTAATFKRDAVVDRIMAKMSMEKDDRQKIYKLGWLNVEELYRERGWDVTYDEPAYLFAKREKPE
jgi:hypothetical protein